MRFPDFYPSWTLFVNPGFFWWPFFLIYPWYLYQNRVLADIPACEIYTVMCTHFLSKGSPFPLIFPEANNGLVSVSLFSSRTYLWNAFILQEAFEWINHLILPCIFRFWGVQVTVFFHCCHCPFTSPFKSRWLIRRADHISQVCKPSFQDSFTCKGVFGR